MFLEENKGWGSVYTRKYMGVAVKGSVFVRSSLSQIIISENRFNSLQKLKIEHIHKICNK